MCIPCCGVNSVWVMGVCETHGLRAGDRDVHSLLWCEQCVGDGGVCETHGLRAGDRDVHSLLCEQCVGDGCV